MPIFDDRAQLSTIKYGFSTSFSTFCPILLYLGYSFLYDFTKIDIFGNYGRVLEILIPKTIDKMQKSVYNSCIIIKRKDL